MGYFRSSRGRTWRNAFRGRRRRRYYFAAALIESSSLSAVLDEVLGFIPGTAISPVLDEVLTFIPGTSLSPVADEILEVRVPGIKGKQIATGADGVATANLVDGVLAATVAGRAKMASGFFDLTTANDKFAAASIADTKLQALYVLANGTRAFTADQSMGGFKLTNVGTPTAGTDAANKAYVDALAAGFDPKQSVRLATVAALPAYTPAGSGVGKTLTANANGALSLDGVAVVAGNRVLVKDEGGGTSIHNGVYTVTQPGTAGTPFILTRATDFDGGPTGPVSDGAFMFVGEGAALNSTGWVLITNDPITVDTTALTFTQATGPGSLTYGTPVDVGTANNAGTGFDVARANHVHRSPKPTTADKSRQPTATTGNYQSTGITITATPALGGHVQVFANGLGIPVGNGNRDDLGGFTGNVGAYFSNDGGTTARAQGSIVAGDTLYWNGTHIGYDLTTAYQIDLIYEIF